MQPTSESYSEISAGTIAKMTGATPDEAERWTKEPSFPNPVARLSTGKLYDRRAVERWLLEHDKLGMEIPPAP
jgi:hypothetical protein